MSVYSLKNEELSIEVKSAGAELTSIKDVATQTEYLWCGDSKYWGRQSPVLFPFVGSLKNKEYKCDGQTFTMGQHGFARDKEFELLEQTENEIWFVLTSNEETKILYPFDFELKIGYKLEARKVIVMWKVINKDDKLLPFSIGGHPAFMCPINENDKQSDYYIITDAKDKLICGEINMDTGLLIRGKENILELDKDGAFRITDTMFDNDALIVESDQVHTLSLATSDKKPYVTMKFDMPLCGIWSPAKKNAPFVCLEPWCGRCDANDFEGQLEEREYGTILEPGEEFDKCYELEFAKN